MRRRRKFERQGYNVMQFWYNLGADYVHEDKTIWVKKNTFLVRGKESCGLVVRCGRSLVIVRLGLGTA